MSYFRPPKIKKSVHLAKYFTSTHKNGFVDAYWEEKHRIRGIYVEKQDFIYFRSPDTRENRS